MCGKFLVNKTRYMAAESNTDCLIERLGVLKARGMRVEAWDRVLKHSQALWHAHWTIDCNRWPADRPVLKAGAGAGRSLGRAEKVAISNNFLGSFLHQA